MITHLEKCAISTLVWLLALVLSPTLATAQDDPPPEIELDARQIELNNEAVQALGKDPPNTAKAIELVQAALVLGSEADLLFLTLGRAHQLAQECREADETFARVESAPRVKGLPRDFVKVQLRKYRQEMRQTCPGTLEVVCKPETLELTLKDEPFPCGEAVELAPGNYTIRARNPETGASVSLQAEVVGMTDRSTEIELASPVKAPDKDPDKDPEKDPDKEPDKVPDKTPEFEPTTTFDLIAHVPVGLCNLRLTSASGVATDANICGGVGVELGARRSFSKLLGAGVYARPRVVGGFALSVNGEAARIAFVETDLSAGLWLKDSFAVELDAQLRGSSIELDGASVGSYFKGVVGPGVRFDSKSLAPKMPRLRAHARLGLAPTTSPYLNIGATMHVVEKFVIGVDYDYQLLDKLESTSGDSYEFNARSEQLLLSFGFPIF